MKKLLISLCILGLFNFAQAQSKPEVKNDIKKEAVKKTTVVKEAAKKEAEKVNASGKIFNKYCPIMGEEVDSKLQTVAYNGKTIGFCCKKCIKKFSSDPEKYIKHLSADGQKYIK